MRTAAFLVCLSMALEVVLSKHPIVQQMTCCPQNWTDNQRASEWKVDDKNGKSDPHWGLTNTEGLDKVMDGFLSLCGLEGHDAAICCTLTVKGCNILSIYMTRAGDEATECFLHTCLESEVQHFGIRAKKGDSNPTARIQVFCDKPKKSVEVDFRCAAGNRCKYCAGFNNYCLAKNFTLSYVSRNE